MMVSGRQQQPFDRSTALQGPRSIKRGVQGVGGGRRRFRGNVFQPFWGDSRDQSPKVSPVAVVLFADMIESVEVEVGENRSVATARPRSRCEPTARHCVASSEAAARAVPLATTRSGCFLASSARRAASLTGSPMTVYS